MALKNIFGAFEVVAHAHGDSCLMASVAPGPLSLCMLAAVSTLLALSRDGPQWVVLSA